MLDKTARWLLNYSWLSYVDFARIAWVKESKLGGELGACVICRKSLSYVTTFVTSDCSNVVPKDTIEGLASTFSEPDFKVRIPWKRIEKRLDLPLPIIRSKNWLTKLFIEKITIRYIKSFEINSSLVYQNKSKSCDD